MDQTARETTGRKNVDLHITLVYERTELVGSPRLSLSMSECWLPIEPDYCRMFTKAISQSRIKILLHHQECVYGPIGSPCSDLERHGRVIVTRIINNWECAFRWSKSKQASCILLIWKAGTFLFWVCFLCCVLLKLLYSGGGMAVVHYIICFQEQQDDTFFSFFWKNYGKTYSIL